MIQQPHRSANLLPPLEAFYEREQQRATDVATILPYPGGSVREFTGKALGYQTRAMASSCHSLERTAP